MNYTDEELIEELQYFSEYLGRVPTAIEVTKDRFMPSAPTYQNRFGTWNNALNAAGLSNTRNPEYTKQELLNLLKSLSKEIGRTPNSMEVTASSTMPSKSTYVNKFGSWNNAIIKAGLKPNCNQSHITEDNLALSYNKEWLKKQNKTKTLQEISKDLGYSKHRMSSRFKELDIESVKHDESLKEKEWLDSLGIEERQYPIENYRVDGYDPETNTVYEFLGDYWHGNPDVYDPDDYNAVCNKTFGQLFDETMGRLNYIKSLGYNIITQWEKDFEC